MQSFRSPSINNKRVLWLVFAVLRFFLVLAVIAYLVVEFIEFRSHKEVLHLTMFSMFFLLANFQVNIGRHKEVVKDVERAESLFVLSMFALAAALLELVDLGFDQLIGGIDSVSVITGINLVEAMLGVCAVLLTYYSVDRFLVALRSISADFRSVRL